MNKQQMDQETLNYESINPPLLKVSHSVIESRKSISFTNTRMGEKFVDAIGGIGVETKNKMAVDGIVYAYQLVGYYLMKGKNEKDLEILLKNYGLSHKNTIVAKNCVISYCDMFC